MKIIHTGDIHIGSAFQGLSGEKARLRQAEIVSGFRRLCAYAKAEKVGAVLIAGDLFDDERVSAQTLRETFSAVAEAAPVPFFYASGNHDSDVDLSVVGGDLPANLYLFSKNRGFLSYELPEKVTVTGMDGKYFSLENFSTLALKEDFFNVVLLHGEIEKEIPLSYLKNKHIDYLALGHIHKPDAQAIALDSRGKYRYCGCPEGRGFDETGARGFFLIDVQKGKIVREQFLSFAKRTVVEVRVDISACRNYFDVENAALFALQTTGRENIVKIVLCGSFAAGLKKDIPLLTERLQEAFFFVKIEDTSRLFLDPAVFENDCTERGEFVREVGRYELSEEMRSEILEVGLKALAGEEIDL